MLTTLVACYVLGVCLFAYIGGRIGLEDRDAAIVFLWPLVLVFIGPLLFVRWLLDLGQKHGGY